MASSYGQALAESRARAYSKEQLLEQSLQVFVGEVTGVQTLVKYKKTLPNRARVLLRIKGEGERGVVEFTPKGPGKSAVMDEEFNLLSSASEEYSTSATRRLRSF